MYELPQKGFVYITGRTESFVSFFLSSIKDRSITVFYEGEDEALLLKEEVEFFSGREVHYFPMYTERLFEKEDEAKRIAFLHHLLSDDAFVGLFPLRALSHPLLSRDLLTTNSREINFGATVFQEEFVGYLEKTGYEIASLVREEGQFAKRGAIIDVFTSSSSQPVRIEFLGDQVYSIRFFDPLTQRSLKEIEKCLLIPAGLSGKSKETILEYLPKESVVVHRGLNVIVRELEEGDRGDEAATFLSFLNIDTSGVRGDEEGPVFEAVSNQDLRDIFEAKKTEIFKTLTLRLTGDWASTPYVYIFAVNRHQAERLQEIFRNYDVTLPIANEMSHAGRDREWAIVIGPLRRGFRTKEIIILTEEDIVGPKKRVTRKRWQKGDSFLESFRDLSVGECVVHIENGIGIYRGIKKLKIDGHEKDFLLIEYQDEDKLYVPIESLELVQKYIGGEKGRPKIDKLGTGYWKNTKSKVKKHVEDIAEELLKFYAERELSKGHAYPPDDELFREMEERFEYEETEGQLQAIEEVLGDLRNEKPMDRLVCGDVGFGKTEVALRAAFKAVTDSKQTAVLVPTTVLAQQHYATFTERFRDYPVTVEVLSRFKGKAEQAQIAEQVRKGLVDVIIGTHRLLQRDIAFKDLGLLVIDEEHRFGVKAKEKLKFLKKNVDVLTLSATPIPRTLHMAITGIKDLSIIDTPPLDRLAVKTYVVKFNDDLIGRAISDELKRGGQVFFVHNVIHNIGVVFEHLKTLLPDARIVVAHGKMDGKQLEKVMLDFINKKADVLLSTNIIESGLDITNVNTLFINNAHKFGLADLYQLRGRVGRSTKQAYAYMLVPKEEVLTRDALLRLKIIEEMTELGSGLKVANYDLEIRGTGNLLGREQSGQINLIGFELYCHMLEEAAKRLRDEVQEEEEIVTELNIPLNAFIPDSYMGDENVKLLTYKRLSKIRDEDEIPSMEEELRDRYGEIPEPLQNLLRIIGLRIFLSRLRVKRLEMAGSQVVLHVTDGTPLKMEKLLKLVKEDKGKVKVLPDGKIIMQRDLKTGDFFVQTRNLLMEITGL
jgi:transcription-repair coupling factor (superfamily II helicase)